MDLVHTLNFPPFMQSEDDTPGTRMSRNPQRSPKSACRATQADFAIFEREIIRSRIRTLPE
jgi:hypothetical protein